MEDQTENLEYDFGPVVLCQKCNKDITLSTQYSTEKGWICEPCQEYD